jgi:biopolymer transport protein ExbB
MLFINNLMLAFNEAQVLIGAIFVFLLAGIGLMIERAWYLFFKCGSNRKAFIGTVGKYVMANDFERAIKFAASQQFPLAKAIHLVLQNRGKGKKAAERAVEELTLSELPKLNRFIPLLSTIANLVTLLGLAATVYGVIIGFDSIANVPVAQRAGALAAGIAVALTATLFALCVAIPSLLMANIFETTAYGIADEIEEKTTKLINMIEE